MYFRKFKKKDMAQEGRIGVLVVSHGPVASGMAQVANAIMGTEHAVGVDMNLWDTPAQMAEKTVDMARRVNQGKGCIVLADMGSLLNVGQKSGGDRHAGQSAAPYRHHDGGGSSAKDHVDG